MQQGNDHEAVRLFKPASKRLDSASPPAQAILARVRPPIGKNRNVPQLKFDLSQSRLTAQRGRDGGVESRGRAPLAFARATEVDSEI
jgi:hypothetical protein